MDSATSRNFTHVILPRLSLFFHDRIGYLLGSIIEMSCLATDVKSHFALPIVVGNCCGIWYHFPIVGDAIVYLVNIDHFLIFVAFLSIQAAYCEYGC